MLSRIKFWKNIAKDFVIEVTSIGIAYVANILLADTDNPSDLLPSVISLRMYYLSKNVFNFIDTRCSKTDSSKHLYAGSFNAGVASMLYPAIKFIGMHSVSERMATSMGVYTGGVLLSSFIEKKHEMQTWKMYLKNHQGSLVCGAGGVIFSGLNGANVTSPSFYWSGQMIDIFMKRNVNYSLLDIFISTKTTVPLQVFSAYFLKLGLNLAQYPLPFPGYIIDFLLGFSHRMVVHARDHLCLPQEEKPMQQVTLGVAENKIIIQEAKVLPLQVRAGEDKPVSSVSIENSSLALVQLMSRGATLFQVAPNPASVPQHVELLEATPAP